MHAFSNVAKAAALVVTYVAPWDAATIGWTVEDGVAQLRQLVELLSAEAGEEIEMLLNTSAASDIDMGEASRNAD